MNATSRQQCVWEFEHPGCESCFVKNGLCLTSAADSESYWSFPDALGRGGFRKIVIRKDFELWITDCFPYRDILCQEKNVSSAVLFGFCLQGMYSGRLDKGRFSFSLASGEHSLFCCSKNLQGSGRMVEGEQHFFVSLLIGSELVLSYLDDDRSLLQEVLREVMSSSDDRFLFRVEQMTSDMRVALGQIIDCPYRGTSRRLFLESRCLELMAYQLQQFSGDCLAGSCHRGCVTLHPSERIKIERVRRFLLDNLASPVKLHDLAAIAGMSHPKLNRCFRQFYGRTVFEFLRVERLLKARELIDMQGRSVTEAAYMAGYSSLSHFSKVYRQYFGVSAAPGTRRKKRA